MTLTPMTPERERQLIAAADGISTLAEAQSFRATIRDGGEQMTVDLMRALRDRIDLLAKREGRL